MTPLHFTLESTVAQTATEFLGQQNAALTVGFLVALIGGIQLVFNIGGKARDHAIFQARFYNLLARAERPTDDPNALAAEIEAEMATFYGEEPPTYHAVNAIAYNAAQNAFGRDDRSALFKLTFWQNALKDLRHFSPDDLKTIGEIEAERLGSSEPHAA